MRVIRRNLDFLGNWPDSIPADVGTFIISNGSHWAGEAVDDIPTLCARLETEPLRGDFLDGPFGYDCASRKHGMIDRAEAAKYAGWKHYHGNFENVSAVFSVYTRDPALVLTLNRLGRANRANATGAK